MHRFVTVSRLAIRSGRSSSSLITSRFVRPLSTGLIRSTVDTSVVSKSAAFVAWRSLTSAATAAATSTKPIESDIDNLLVNSSNNNDSAINEVNSNSDSALPTKFVDVKSISAPTLKALSKNFGYSDMTPVQQIIGSRMPITEDMLVKAKTGTGKTLAFLIPAIEAALAGGNMANNRNRHVSVMVLSPTRELAKQIQNEADRLLQYHRMRSVCLVGGENKARQLRALTSNRCDFVVGTPGRIRDLLETDRYFGEEMVKSLKLLVLDEADELLNMGFRDEIEQILRLLPKERRTWLFSATLTRDIQEVASMALQANHEYVDAAATDGADEDAGISTSPNISQSYIEADPSTHVHVVHKLIRDHIDERLAAAKASADYTQKRSQRSNSGESPAKILVFLPTTRGTELYASLFRDMLTMRYKDRFESRFGDRRASNIQEASDGHSQPVRVYEIHSRKTQERRTRTSDEFRAESKPAVMFTSDVSARGVDYKDVSLVIQVGIPQSSERYIHRVGRAGRAGRKGEGVLVVAPGEVPFVDTLRSGGYSKLSGTKHAPVPIEPASEEKWSQDAIEKLVEQNMTEDTTIGDAWARSFERIREGEMVDNAFTAFLGYYAQFTTALDLPGRDIVDMAKQYTKGFGLEEAPYVSPALLQKIGLSTADRRQPARSRKSSFSSSRGGYRGSNGNRDGNNRSFERRNQYGSDSYSRDNRKPSLSFSKGNGYSRNDRYDRSDRGDRSDRSDRYSRGSERSDRYGSTGGRRNDFTNDRDGESW
ncbi:DEAD-domain-containing protein [Ramicandelaber brevisporus]|nr:DEAD-domain-containing protein [Ramicandelaber brevisporus]